MSNGDKDIEWSLNENGRRFPRECGTAMAACIEITSNAAFGANYDNFLIANSLTRKSPISGKSEI